MIYPAIDLQGGSSVRLYQGDFKQETLVSADPIRQARLIREAGIGGSWMALRPVSHRILSW